MYNPKAIYVGFTVQGKILTFVNIQGQRRFCVTLCSLPLAQLTVVELAPHRDQDNTIYGHCLL